MNPIIKIDSGINELNALLSEISALEERIKAEQKKLKGLKDELTTGLNFHSEEKGTFNFETDKYSFSITSSITSSVKAEDKAAFFNYMKGLPDAFDLISRYCNVSISPNKNLKTADDEVNEIFDQFFTSSIGSPKIVINKKLQGEIK